MTASKDLRIAWFKEAESADELVEFLADPHRAREKDRANMKVSAVKIEAGLYRVVIDGRATDLLIGKGQPPKYGHPQLWEVGRRVGDDIRWIVGDQRGLANALDTIRTIAMSVSQQT